MPERLATVKQAARENLPLSPALEELRQCGHAEIPVAAVEGAPWTPAQERAVTEALRSDTSPCAWMDSLAISEMMLGWEHPEGSVSSLEAVEFGLQAWPAGVEENIFSPSGGPPAGKAFWFNVNAELVIYGATERDATVTIGGRKIALRPDGSFSFRYALPDGQYVLAVVAVSAEGTDGRAAELRFTRTTKLVGDVQTHPQDPALKPPASQKIH